MSSPGEYMQISLTAMTGKSELNRKELGEEIDVQALYKKGVELRELLNKHSDYQETFNCFNLAAKKGNVDAHYELGCMFENYHIKNYRRRLIDGDCKFFIPCPKKAFEHYNLAAEQGHKEAQYCLAKMLNQDYLFDSNNLQDNGKQLQTNTGNINLPDIPGATKWYTLAAQQDHEGAIEALKILHSNQQDQHKEGVGSPNSEATTQELEETELKFKVEECRTIDLPGAASFQQGSLALGEAVISDFALQPPEIQEIVKNNIEFLVNGDADQQYRLSAQYEQMKWYRHAFVWLQRAANQGHSGAQYKLGCFYKKYEGLLEDENAHSLYFPDSEQAFVWYSQAAVQGVLDAKYALGKLSEIEGYAAEDRVEAHRFFRKAKDFYMAAAELGHVKSQYRLGCLYKTRHDIDMDKPDLLPVNTQKVFYWINKAAEHGYVDAEFELANLYKNEMISLFIDGNEIELPNLEKAEAYFIKAAEKNHLESLYSLGILYSRQSTEKGKEKALFFYNCAAQKGHEESVLALKSLQAKQEQNKELTCLKQELKRYVEQTFELRKANIKESKKVAMLETTLKKELSNREIVINSIKNLHSSDIECFKTQLAAQQLEVQAKDEKIATLNQIIELQQARIDKYNCSLKDLVPDTESSRTQGVFNSSAGSSVILSPKKNKRIEDSAVNKESSPTKKCKNLNYMST